MDGRALANWAASAVAFASAKAASAQVVAELLVFPKAEGCVEEEEGVKKAVFVFAFAVA